MTKTEKTILRKGSLILVHWLFDLGPVESEGVVVGACGHSYSLEDHRGRVQEQDTTLKDMFPVTNLLHLSKVCTTSPK